jgi:hypothetical protein
MYRYSKCQFTRDLEAKRISSAHAGNRTVDVHRVNSLLIELTQRSSLEQNSI